MKQKPHGRGLTDYWCTDYEKHPNVRAQRILKEKRQVLLVSADVKHTQNNWLKYADQTKWLKSR